MLNDVVTAVLVKNYLVTAFAFIGLLVFISYKFSDWLAAVFKIKSHELDVNSVIEQSKGKLANFKAPKYLVIVEELPRNTMGKVQKKQLRNAYKHLFD